MQLIGSVSGEVSPDSFNVVLTSTVTGRGSYVKLNHEEYGWVLAKLGDSRRNLNAAGEEVVLSKAYTVGYKQDGVIRFPKTPFKPLERVYLADEDLIINVLGLKKSRKGSVYLGVLDGCKIPVYLDLNKMIRKHVSVLAMTGAGKSYTVGVILEELLKNDVPIVIIDPHGEYSSLRYENDDYDMMMPYGVRPASYDKKIVEYTTSPLTNPGAKKIGLRMNFTAEELSKIMPVKLADKQKLLLYNALRRISHKEYTIDDLIESVKAEKGKDKWKIISVLESMQNANIFDGHQVTEKELVKAGNTSIIDLKGSEPWVQQLVVSRMARDLFTAVKARTIPAFFFLIEEAHNFCPERGFGEAMSSEILRTIASEGRKFGMHLCVVSQRPARVDKNVLSQCNTQIILKVTNPNDLRAIGQSIEGFTSGMEDEIKQLSVGQAIVVGECVEQPITVNIRARETRHLGAVEAKAKGDSSPKRLMRPEVIKAMTPLKEEKEPAPEKPGKAEEKNEPEIVTVEPPEQSLAPTEKKNSIRKRIIKIFLKDDEEMRKD